MTALNRLRVISQHLVGSIASQKASQGRVMQFNPTTGNANRGLERISRIVHQLTEPALKPSQGRPLPMNPMIAQSSMSLERVLKITSHISPPKLIERVAKRPPPLPPRPPASFFDLFHQSLHSFLAFFKLV